MHEIQVEVVDGALNFRPRGPAVGRIYFDFGAFQFPDQNWTDFVVVMVGVWLSDIARFQNSNTDEIKFRFMDGPYTLLIKKGGAMIVRCLGLNHTRMEMKSYSSAKGLLLVF